MIKLSSLTLFLLFTLPLWAKQIEVCPDCPLKSIAAAVERAEAGDVLIIKPGRYEENFIVIDKPMTIKGIDYPVLDGREKGEIITVTADHVTIQGLRFENVGTSYLKDHAAIRVRKGRNFKIQANILQNAFFGIYLENTRDGIIRENTIEGEAIDESSSGNGIHAWYCKNIHIENNVVAGHRDGIYFEFVDSSRISGNKSRFNIRYGLHFMFSNNDRYTDNLFEANGAGVAVMFSKKIDMIGNTFRRNWGRAAYGLLLKEIYDAEIRENTLEENTIGIHIEGSTRVLYTENRFARNGWALRMAGGCLDNHFTRNDFIGNTLDLVLNSRVNNNVFNKNYWSEYTGYDLDRNGFGDVPHRPVKLFSYILEQSPESIVLLRSLFIDIINFSEKVSPIFTPENVLDHQPLMQSVL